MTFIKKTDKGYLIANEIPDEKNLIKGFLALIEKERLDSLPVSCGVNPAPDFGYLELADRYWRASLSIYFFGISNGFWERGAGMFRVRHDY
jgi:hypothetical protein